MASQHHSSRPRGDRRGRQLRPHLLPLEQRVVLSLQFPGIAGVTFDSAGDVFVSYNSSDYSSQQQSVAEVDSSGFLVTASVFGTTGASALPGALATVGSSVSIPSISANDILELLPDGELLDYNSTNGLCSSCYDLANYTANASNVFDVQTGASVNLSNQISLGNATYGDFGVYENSLVVSAETNNASNNWDFVMRLSFGSSGADATVLVASPASDGQLDSPEGVAVITQGIAQGTVLTTLPYVPAGSTTAIHVPVGFNLFYDMGNSPAPVVPTLGLSSAPNIDSAGITVDSQGNFILAATDSSLYGGGPGVVHINSALSAFLADPLQSTRSIPTGIAYQNVGGTDYLAITNAASDTYTVAGELPLFSGQVSPAQLRHAYGIDQISFTGPGGTTVTGDGSGQTIAIVEDGIDPTLGADLNTFDQFFGIPAPPSFKVIDQSGATTDLDIVGEASLDVEWAHAVAPGASIVVYNAGSTFQDLVEAMQQASKLPGVSVVTLSYGLPESSLSAAQEKSFDADFTTPNVTFLAAAGDSGIYGNGGFEPTADYPAASPNVVAVGGTSIVIDSNGDYPGTGEQSGEVAWGDGQRSGEDGGGGGGLSAVEPEPAWQSGGVPSSMDPDGTRALPDVSMDSGSAQEYDVFTSTLSGSSDSESAVGWLGDAGTSAASPIWAGLIAIADQGRALEGGTPLTGYTQTLPALYSLPAADFHDILYGNNGDPAGPGYDLATGLGTPVANLLVPDLASYQIAAAGNATQVGVSPSPLATVFGQTVTVTATVSFTGAGTGAPIGSVTLEQGSTILNTATLTDGSADFSITPSAAGTETLTIAYGGDASAGDQPSSVEFKLTVAKAAATLNLGNLSFTYDGAPRTAVVTTTPAGLSDVTVTYAQNSVVVTNPTHAGDYTVTATLDNSDYAAPVVTGTLVINQATPTITWTNPANITVGTALGAAQLDAVVAFGGMELPGVLTYNPPSGTVLPTGNGQMLSVSFAPKDDTDFKSVTSSVRINVVTQSTPPPPQAMVIGEQPVFQRKLNKNGKPTGAEVLTGFTLKFNMPLNAAAVSYPADYELETVTIKAVNKRPVRVLKPIEGFTVTYTPGSDSVTLKLVSTSSFVKGGQLTVLPGVTSGSGSVLKGTTVFTITAGGKKIKPA
ncbi:MAG: MBG domain-containing protein [Isosphaeraceae bacterium]